MERRARLSQCSSVGSAPGSARADHDTVHRRILKLAEALSAGIIRRLTGKF